MRPGSKSKRKLLASKKLRTLASREDWRRWRENSIATQGNVIIALLALRRAGLAAEEGALDVDLKDLRDTGQMTTCPSNNNQLAVTRAQVEETTTYEIWSEEKWTNTQHIGVPGRPES